MAVKKIRQIIPADGWTALFLNDTYVMTDTEPGDDLIRQVPLACWALAEFDDAEGRRVAGVSGNELMNIVEEDMCWFWYLAPGQPIDDAIRERAKNQLAWLRMKVQGAPPAGTEPSPPA